MKNTDSLFCDAPQIRIQSAQTPSERAACLAIRREVFVEEQGVSPDEEIDGLDAPGKCEFFLVTANGEPVGTARAHFCAPGVVHLQRFCIKKSCRGKGFGRATLTYIEAHYRAAGAARLQLHAQCHAIGFYESCGFRVTSDTFLDAGIPHKTMEKDL